LIIIAYIVDFNYPCGKSFYNKKDFVEYGIYHSLLTSYFFSIISLITIIPLNIYGFGNWCGVLFIPIAMTIVAILQAYLFRKFSNYIAQKETLHFVYRQKLKRIIKRAFIITTFVIGNLLLLYFKSM
jgi:mannose/fructose/N-acetylgalactosamine-specific phosphotransferase system component IID